MSRYEMTVRLRLGFEARDDEEADLIADSIQLERFSTWWVGKEYGFTAWFGDHSDRRRNADIHMLEEYHGPPILSTTATASQQNAISRAEQTGVWDADVLGENPEWDGLYQVGTSRGIPSTPQCTCEGGVCRKEIACND